MFGFQSSGRVTGALICIILFGFAFMVGCGGPEPAKNDHVAEPTEPAASEHAAPSPEDLRKPNMSHPSL